MNKEPLFRLTSVSKSIGGKTLLDNISLQIEAGDFLSILGPSGAGKSTLLRLFNGLDSPTAGTIEYQGKPLFSYPMTGLRKRVGMVFQNPVMVRGTVRDNLLLTQRWEQPSTNLAEETLVSVLAQVDLSPAILDQDTKTISGGEKQRVALARVLLNKPEVLLLDEPTANLDPQLARRIVRLIHQLFKQLKLTIIMVSHDYSLLSKYTTRIAFLIGGRIVEEGAADILEQPSTETVKTFLAKGAI
ncbi:MAG: ATP-binding cassette domain-containing protein [FCB group bacterium]|nr:ATP-binding cassette domain-containing protein [FCB group bacterium]